MTLVVKKETGVVYNCLIKFHIKINQRDNNQLQQLLHYRERQNLILNVLSLGEVYAIGGYNGVKTVDVVEKFDPEEGAWKEVAPLTYGRSVPGIAVAYLWPVQSTMRKFWENTDQQL